MVNTRRENGVLAGGLIDINEIKILICYILNVLNCEIAHNDLIEVLTGDELVNYFDAGSAISELLSQKLITVSSKKQKENYYKVTPEGVSLSATLDRPLISFLL